MGAAQSGEVDQAQLATSSKLTPAMVADIVEAFKEKNKKAKPVSRKAFIKVMTKVGTKYPNEEVFNVDNLTYVYSLFDVDHDGKVGVEELVKGISILSSGSLEEKARLTFQAMDLDNSGQLTKSEVKAHFEKLMAMTSKMGEKHICEQVEADSGQKMSPWMARLILKPVMYAVRKMIEDDVVDKVFSADADGDGKISMTEWMAAVDTNEFVKYCVCPELFVENVKQEMMANA